MALAALPKALTELLSQAVALNLMAGSRLVPNPKTGVVVPGILEVVVSSAQDVRSRWVFRSMEDEIKWMMRSMYIDRYSCIDTSGGLCVCEEGTMWWHPRT